MAIQRRRDLLRFYELLSRLERNLGGSRLLKDCNGKMKWPRRGFYFFLESGENRSDTGMGPRIVRVGTHALKSGSRTTLWGRLSRTRAGVGLLIGSWRFSTGRIGTRTRMLRSSSQYLGRGLARLEVLAVVSLLANVIMLAIILLMAQGVRATAKGAAAFHTALAVTILEQIPVEEDRYTFLAHIKLTMWNMLGGPRLGGPQSPDGASKRANFFCEEVHSAFSSAQIADWGSSSSR